MKDHIWTPTGTDISHRWRLNGWVAPSDSEEYKNKWKYYQNLPLRNLDDSAKEQYEHVMRKARVSRIK